MYRRLGTPELLSCEVEEQRSSVPGVVDEHATKRSRDRRSLAGQHKRTLGLGLLIAFAACSSPQRPQMKVLGVEEGARGDDGHHIKLFVEVVNYAKRPMRLQRLQYEFGPEGAAGGHGEVSLRRTVEAGSAIVVEVPILLDETQEADGLLLRGQLITEQDTIIRAYPVRATVTDDASL